MVTEDKKLKEMKDLEKKFNALYMSPWEQFVVLSYTEMTNEYKENGYDSAVELMRRADIRAYRAEEAACNNI